MFQKQEWSTGEESGENLRLLPEIESLRKSLAVVNKSPNVQRRSLSISGTYENKRKEDRSKIDLLPRKNAKNPSSSGSSSIWSWKPLRALTHIRHRKLDCRFTVQIHSIEGIPSILDHSRIRVHWRRDGEENGLTTTSVLVSHGAAVFQEILEDRCTVYGSKSSGHHQPVKYQAKTYVLTAMVAGAPGSSLGEHRVDLTRLLPLTAEDLEESSCRWSTAFKLSGRARGALLNVTFGFSLQAGIPPVLNRDSGGRLLLHSQSVGQMKVVREIFPADQGEQFSAEEVPDDCSKIKSVDLRCLNKSPPVLRTDASLPVSKIDLEEELPDLEFTVIDKGIEIVANDTFKIKDDGISHEEIAGSDKRDEIGEFLNDESDKSQLEFHSEPDFDELNCLLQNLSIFGQAEREPLKSDSTSPEQHDPEGTRSNCTVEKDLILDDESEFLRFLGLDNADPSALSSDSDQESPKARLWKQFREESVADREKNIFDLCPRNQVEMNWMEFDSDFDLSETFNGAEMDVRLSQSTNSRRRAKMLDDEEAEALMRDLGLNERAFLHTPPGSPTGFGSPIEVLPDDSGDGPFHVDDDDDDHHQILKNRVRRILQASSPLVIPAKNGSGAIEILQSLGSLGIEKLAVLSSRMMLLDDVPRARDHGDCCSSDVVPLRDLPRLALEEIEALAIEGLKIQTGTSELRVLHAEVQGEHSDSELNSLALSLEEWINAQRRDCDISGKIAAAHCGSLEELATTERNRVILAFMVQLRDEEPVGGPMLALIQAERLPDDIRLFDEDGNLLASGFKATDLHLAGVKSKTLGMRGGASSVEVIDEVCGDGDHIWSISKCGEQSGFYRNPNIKIVS